MALLNRTAILEVKDIKTETIPVPEWGGEVIVKGLSGTERDSFEAESLQGKGKNQTVNLVNLRARLVARSLVDANGERLFADHDVELLGKKSAQALSRVFDVAQRLSGLSNTDVEDLTKNSESGKNAGSGSA
jgi:hypothetical protein